MKLKNDLALLFKDLKKQRIKDQKVAKYEI